MVSDLAGQTNTARQRLADISPALRQQQETQGARGCVAALTSRDDVVLLGELVAEEGGDLEAHLVPSSEILALREVVV
jgi:hypothetical protein